jgi:hypothetical protein
MQQNVTSSKKLTLHGSTKEKGPCVEVVLPTRESSGLRITFACAVTPLGFAGTFTTRLAGFLGVTALADAQRRAADGYAKASARWSIEFRQSSSLGCILACSQLIRGCIDPAKVARIAFSFASLMRRSLQDLVGFLSEIHALRVDLYLHQEGSAVAQRMGCEIVRVHRDNGISGGKGRKDRTGFDALCRAAARREFDLIMA